MRYDPSKATYSPDEFRDMIVTATDRETLNVLLDLLKDEKWYYALNDLRGFVLMIRAKDRELLYA